MRAAEERLGPDLGIWRLSADILRPIPYAPLEVRSSVVRSGRRVALVEASASAADGPVVLARVWGIRTSELLDYPPPPDPLPAPPPPPGECPQAPFAFTDYEWFGDSLDARLASGSIDGPGSATAWFRLRVPVVAGEVPTPVQRLATMIDSGNGISWGLPFGRWLFINSDASMYLLRRPVEEWFAMESVSHYHREGRGIAETRLFDRDGYLGRSQQALFVDVLDV